RPWHWPTRRSRRRVSRPRSPSGRPTRRRRTADPYPPPRASTWSSSAPANSTAWPASPSTAPATSPRSSGPRRTRRGPRSSRTPATPSTSLSSAAWSPTSPTSTSTPPCRSPTPSASTASCRPEEHRARAKAPAAPRPSVAIALFGRMVADVADINVDAAVQVAHALSVHRVDNESDYYTAVDDENTDDETGAGMIGTVDFNSATLYRYAALGVHQLAATLGEGLRDDEPRTEPVRRAVEAF